MIANCVLYYTPEPFRNSYDRFLIEHPRFIKRKKRTKKAFSSSGMLKKRVTVNRGLFRDQVKQLKPSVKVALPAGMKQ
jgi:hypothetical protein